MALVFLGADKFPNYTALSSDIVTSAIPGLNQRGVTVLTTDDGLWYFTLEDLTLIPYAYPIGLSGTITIGEVDQGLKGTEAWLVNNIPPIASTVLGALNGNASQTVTDITGATVGANKIFVGTAHISVAAQNPAATATGSAIATITWVPGTGGTTARRVATVNLELAATGAAINGISDNGVISVPITVYAGSTSGKFQGTVTIGGTVTGILWDFVISGQAQ